MTILEKIRYSQNGVEESKIHLWKEGVFWVAYEQSAYSLWLLKQYKITKKCIKTAGMEVVSIGFPQAALSHFIDMEKECVSALQDKHIILTNPKPCTEVEFSEWKASVSLTNRSTSKGECPIVKEETRTFGIETRLRNFDLSNATPMMCMNFIAELKHDFIIN